MSVPDTNEKRRFEHLNALGWAAWLGGKTVQLAAEGIDYSVREAARVAADTERAFRQGRDGRVEEAHIVEEWKRDEDPPPA